MANHSLAIVQEFGGKNGRKHFMRIDLSTHIYNNYVLLFVSIAQPILYHNFTKLRACVHAHNNFCGYPAMTQSPEHHHHPPSKRWWAAGAQVSSPVLAVMPKQTRKQLILRESWGQWTSSYERWWDTFLLALCLVIGFGKAIAWLSTVCLRR